MFLQVTPILVEHIANARELVMARANVKDKRKAELIDAALHSIAKRGLTETTITHIAKGAGMSRGIINFYFSSKEMLMRETLKAMVEEYRDIWKQAEEGLKEEPYARIRALVDIHFSKRICAPKRLNVMSAFWGHAASHPAYRTQLEMADAEIEHAFTEVLAHYEQVPLSEATHHARQLHALIRGLWLSFMLNPEESARESLALECYAFIDRLTAAPVRITREVRVGDDVPVVRGQAPQEPHYTTSERDKKADASVKKTPNIELVAKQSAPVKVKNPRKTSKNISAIPQQMDIEDLFNRP